MKRFHTLALFAALSALVTGGPVRAQEITHPPTGSFAFEEVLVLAGPPEAVFDAITGDVSGWWDHHFSEKPVAFYIEPRPGGAFMEIFDEAGNGVRHGEVTFAQRGRMLRFEGPLGLTGTAFHGVYTYELEAVGDSTRLKLSVRGAGQMEENIPGIVRRVWRHFLFERFKPWYESGGHLRRGRAPGAQPDD
jgi:uncharacterized protein YndB with AHSA1/START domain